MSEELFERSLKDANYREMETYDITHFFYLAFIAGIVPTVALGTINAIGLRINKVFISLMIILGIMVLLSKAYLIGWIRVYEYDISSREIRLIYNAVAVLFYIIYVLTFKKRYKQHIILGGEKKPIIKAAVAWVIIGTVIEFIVILVGGSIFYDAIL
ncbi:MAG: hypothetical protein K0R15_2575 [Clostridiales bacterium]|nr:hypothetical protein [Clostridiales bacterium]